MTTDLIGHAVAQGSTCYSRTRLSCLEWLGAGILIAFAVGIAMVVVALWPEEGAWWMLGIGVPFFLLALQVIFRIASGPTFVVRILEGRGILSVERRILGLRFEKQYSIGDFVEVRVRAARVNPTSPAALLNLSFIEFLNSSGRRVVSIPTSALERPGAFLQAVYQVNPGLRRPWGQRIL